jgi:uncharacterized protein (DUF697 family)
MASPTETSENFLTNLINTTGSQTQKLIVGATENSGKVLEAIAANPVVKTVSNVWGFDWIKTLLGEVDLHKAKQNLQQLSQKHPNYSPRELAQAIMQQKAIEGGRVGLLTNLIPPLAIGLLGVELAATTKIQAQMVYEIAGAYGLDIEDSTRRGEVLAIFGLSLGGDVIKTGLSLVEIIPLLGPIVGASTNAIMLYSLGQTACLFYEGKIDLDNPQQLQNWQQARDSYWQAAQTQSAIIDQIIAHMVLAAHPDKTWSEILPILETVSPDSVKTVAKNLENPVSLDLLLDKFDPQYSTILLDKCRQIAQQDGEITPAEQAIIDQITSHLELAVNRK